MGLPITGDASTLAKSALGATAQGSWLNTTGAGVSSISDAIAGAYQSKVASNNAMLARSDAANAEYAGQVAEINSKLKTGETIGAEKTAQAANNLDVNVGSPVSVRSATEHLGNMDAALIHYNAARAAYGFRQEASNYATQATLDKLSTGFGIARDTGKVYSSFISGSSALANQKLGFLQSGIGG